MIHAGGGIYRGLLDNLDYRLDQTAPFNTTDSLKNVAVNGLLVTPGSQLKGSLISPSGIQPDPYTPTIVSWSFKIEQQIAANTSLALGYIGSHGYHEALSIDANEPAPTYLANGQAYYPKGAPYLNPALANTTTWTTNGLSSYNALQVDVNKRFTHGLMLRGVYTYSKSLDDGTAWNSSVGANAPGFVMFPLHPKLDWGLSNSDVRNLAVVNGSYELPIHGLHGWQDKLAGGLEREWNLHGPVRLPVYAAVGL